MAETKVSNNVARSMDIVQYFEAYINTTDGHSTLEMKELRNTIMFVHGEIENNIESELAMHITLPLYMGVKKEDEINPLVGYMIRQRFLDVVQGIDYAKKVELANRAGVLDEKYIGRIYKINEYRKWFSHPTAYKMEIQNLKSIPEYLKVLQLLKAVFDGLKLNE